MAIDDLALLPFPRRRYVVGQMSRKVVEARYMCEPHTYEVTSWTIGAFPSAPHCALTLPSCSCSFLVCLPAKTCIYVFTSSIFHPLPQHSSLSTQAHIPRNIKHTGIPNLSSGAMKFSTANARSTV